MELDADETLIKEAKDVSEAIENRYRCVKWKITTKLLHTANCATIARVCILVWKAYGGTLAIFCAKPRAADFVYVWPTGECAPMIFKPKFRKALKMSLRGVKRLRGETEANWEPFLNN